MVYEASIGDAYDSSKDQMFMFNGVVRDLMSIMGIVTKLGLSNQLHCALK